VMRVDSLLMHIDAYRCVSMRCDTVPACEIDAGSYASTFSWNPVSASASASPSATTRVDGCR